MKPTNPQIVLGSDMTEEQVADALMAAPTGSTVFFNQHHEGGPMVEVFETYFALYEIPLYGGEPRFYENLHKSFVKDMVKTCLDDWT